MSDDVTVVVGNPRPASRTFGAARRLGERLAAECGTGLRCFDLAELGAALLEPGAPAVRAVVEAVRGSPVTVLASPTYKATYTGILKLFADQVGTGEMGGALGVPMMVAGTAHHALALDVHLRPLMVEIGFSSPGPGLLLLESDLGAIDDRVDDWLGGWTRWLPPATPRPEQKKEEDRP